jgi:hypothetical protein
MGEAAGRASAISLRLGKLPHELSGAEVQRT